MYVTLEFKIVGLMFESESQSVCLSILRMRSDIGLLSMMGWGWSEFLDKYE